MSRGKWGFLRLKYQKELNGNSNLALVKFFLVFVGLGMAGKKYYLVTEIVTAGFTSLAIAATVNLFEVASVTQTV